MFTIQILHNGEIVEGRFEDLSQRHATVWLAAQDPTSLELQAVANHVGSTVDELSELLQVNQRPVLQDIGQFTAVVFHAPEIWNQKLTLKPHLFLASKEQKDLISVCRGTSVAVEKITSFPARRRLELFQKGSTSLLFAILSEIMAHSFEVLDFLNEEIGRLEERVFEPRLSSSVMKRIFQIKKELIYLQRALTSDREVISEIEKAYGAFLDAKQLSRFRLLHSDATQLIELTTTYRDILISAVEVHLSAISNNLNVVMKKLTAWAAIILVPSLIAGIYGMNFQVLPLATHPTGFWLMVGLMFVSVVSLYSYFKRNDWI